MVAGVGEVVTGVAFTRRMCVCNGIIRSDPHGRGVGDRWHGGLFAFLLLSVNDEEEEEEEHQQNQDDDTSNSSNLIRVHMHGSAGQTVQATYHHHTGLVTACTLPAWVTVACASHVITGGVI